MTTDLFIQAREAEYMDLLKSLTEGAIAQYSEGENPHYWFFIQSLCRKNVFRPEGLDHWWASQKREDIQAWLFQNYYRRNCFMGTGVFSVEDHEQAYLAA